MKCFKVRKILEKSILVGVLTSFLWVTVSCENDFTDIGSNVVNNTKFDTNAVEYNIEIENSPLEKLQSDNITRQLNQYLLGVYANPDYEKLEASIVSQIGLPSNLSDVTNTTDTTYVVTKIDTVFLKLPYQVTLETGATAYELDSVFGDTSKPFTLNIFRSNTFINAFNPLDPTKSNSFYSNANFEKIGDPLNAQQDYQFLPSKNDTMFVVKRTLSNNTIARRDTLKIAVSAANPVPVPFARVPLNEEKFKEIFLDKYESSEFASQQALNDYFRGLIIEASGNQGSVVSYNFNTTNSALLPSIEVYYTNTVFRKNTTTVLDTLYVNNSFPLSGFRVNTYKMDNKTYPTNNEVKIQGTAGSEGKIKLLDQTTIDELRSKQWLINDATLTVYINQAIDTAFAPSRLYLYESLETATDTITTQIKDAVSESLFGGIGGFLNRDASGKKLSYTFKITDYISDIVSGEITTIPDLKLKVFNVTDVPVNSDVFTNFSWNPKAVTLFNNSAINGDKRPTLKISYTEKK